MQARQAIPPSPFERFGAKGHIRFLCTELDELVRTQRLDAIVSIDDTTLSMTRRFAADIRRLAGPSIQEEASHFLPLRVGDVVVTGAGQIPANYVLHAAVAEPAKAIHLTERQLRLLIQRILTRCEALQIHHIAIPLFEAAAGEMTAAEWTTTVIDVLRRHARFATVLNNVKLIVPDMRVLEDILGTPWGDTRDGADTGDSLGGPALTERHDRATTPTIGTPTRHGFDPQASVPIEEVPTRVLFHGLREALRQWMSPKPEPRTASSQTAASPAHQPTVTPRVLNERYVVLEELGRGGFGIVHLAWDLVLRRTVAIKTLREDLTSSSALQAEAAIVLDLTHDAIVRAYHFEPRPEPYLVMEYMSWVTAERWLADAGQVLLPVHAVLNVGRQLCAALRYAHERSVLHLDIKPGNVFVDSAGERAKLSDFGTARVTSGDRRVALQTTPVGTAAYMAPEQWQIGARLSPATDLYQLGATLWDLLVGHPYQSSEPLPPVDADRGRMLNLLQCTLATDPSQRPDAGSFERLLASEGAAA